MHYPGHVPSVCLIVQKSFKMLIVLRYIQFFLGLIQIMTNLQRVTTMWPRLYDYCTTTYIATHIVGMSTTQYIPVGRVVVVSWLDIGSPKPLTLGLKWVSITHRNTCQSYHISWYYPCTCNWSLWPYFWPDIICAQLPHSAVTSCDWDFLIINRPHHRIVAHNVGDSWWFDWCSKVIHCDWLLTVLHRKHYQTSSKFTIDACNLLQRNGGWVSQVQDLFSNTKSLLLSKPILESAVMPHWAVSSYGYISIARWLHQAEWHPGKSRLPTDDAIQQCWKTGVRGQLPKSKRITNLIIKYNSRWSLV